MVETLEAAHITPFALGGTMTVTNGILLRADVHSLFDLGLLTVDADRWRVVVHPKVLGTTSGRELDGLPIRLPEPPAKHPERAALDDHRLRHRL